MPEGLVVALTGNLHNRLAVGTARDPDLRPMGLRLAEALPSRVVSLELAHAGGRAWVCTGSRAEDCGVLTLRARASGRAAGVTIEPAEGVDARRGELFLGSVTASRPARETAAE